MADPAGQILLADIGATNARFALLREDGEIGPVRIRPVAEYPRFTDAVADFLQGQGAAPAAAVLAVAGLVEDERAVMTNCPWGGDAAGLREALGTSARPGVKQFEAAARLPPAPK